MEIIEVIKPRVFFEKERIVAYCYFVFSAQQLLLDYYIQLLVQKCNRKYNMSSESRNG